jgi:uncharacterized delta-60 repeat protein
MGWLAWRRWGSRVVVAMALSAVGVGVALAAPGDLDVGFDGDGRRTLDYGGGDSAEAVLVQPDGKIVVAGGGNPNSDFAVARFHPDGSLDASFDGDGVVGVNFGGVDQALAVALQADGKLVVAGETSVGFDVALIRLNADGSLDANFDGDGRRTSDASGDSGQDVLVQPDGKIVVTGFGTPNGDVVVARFNPDGSPDPSFDTDGVVGVNFGGTADLGLAVALQGDGKLVVAGWTSVGNDVLVLRLNADGSLDANFDGDGKRTLDFGGDDRGQDVLVQPDGRIVVAGHGNANRDVAVARFMPDGSLDPSFDTDGVVGVDFGGVDLGLALARQANGKLVVVGATGGDIALVRLNVDGSLDTGFDYDAKKTIDISGVDRAQAVAVQPDGRIVLAGVSGAGPGVGDVALARVEGDPPPPAPPAPPPPPAAPPPPPAMGVRRCAGVVATIVGTSGGDVVRGTRGRDVIAALAGDDVVSGVGGDDLVCGGPGDDTLRGGAGADRLLGGPGADVLRGQAGPDALLGGAGVDDLGGGAGADVCTGGPGADRAVCETRRTA